MESLAHEPFRMTVEQRGEDRVLHLAGAASMDTAPEFEARLAEIAEASPRRIVFDMADLHFLGAESLDAMLYARRVARLGQGRIRLVNPNDDIRRLLDLTRLTHLFPVYTSIDEALAT